MAKKTNLKPSVKNNIVKKILSPVKEFKLKHFLLLAIILISALLRLYKSQELFFWHVDEDIIGLTVKRILVDHRPQLIGFPIPGGIYLGPLIYYIISVPYALSLMNPQVLPVFSAIIGSITVFLIYKVGKTIFEDEKVGFFAALIYGLSYLSNVYSRLLTGLSIVGILALLTYLFLYQNLRSKKPTNLLLIAMILIISAQNEATSLSLIVLVAISWIIYRFKVPAKTAVISILLFIVFHIPLLVFNLRHNFNIFRSFLNFFTKSPESASSSYNLSNIFEVFPKTLSRFLFISGNNDINGQILPCSYLVDNRNYTIIFAYILAVLILGYFLGSQILNKKISIGPKIITIHLGILLIGLTLFNLFLKGYFYEWTLVIFFPGFALITSYFLVKLISKGAVYKIIIFFFLTIFVFINAKSIITSSNEFGFGSKVQAVKAALDEASGRPFYLDSIGSCFQEGYIYLFWYFGRQPFLSYADDIFGPGIIQKPDIPKPKLGVVMVNKGEVEMADFYQKYNFYKSKASKVIDVNEIQVLIVEEK